MKKLILIIFLIPSILFSQDILKEEDSFYKNGKPEIITYKNFDLEIVKRETYSPSGKLLSLFNYDPKTGKRDGDFIDLDNKGYYDQGVLNCDDYTFAIEGNEYDGTGTFWNGKIKNGRPIGEIKVYNLTEKLEVADTQLDTELSYYASVDAGRRVNLYRAVYRSLGFKTENVSKLFYNEYGYLEGKQEINYFIDLYFKKGNIDGIVIKNKENLNIPKDSVFKGNKIWKVDNKFVKNGGLIFKYKWDELKPYTFISSNNQNYDGYYIDVGHFFSENSIIESIPMSLSDGSPNTKIKAKIPYKVSQDLDEYTRIENQFRVINKQIEEYNNIFPYTNDFGIFKNVYTNTLNPDSEPYVETPEQYKNFITTLEKLNGFSLSNVEYYGRWASRIFPYFFLASSDASSYDHMTVWNYYWLRKDMYNTFEKEISCNDFKYINDYINNSSLEPDSKKEFIKTISLLDCSKPIKVIDILSVLKKIIDSKNFPISNIYVFNDSENKYESMFKNLGNNLADLEQKKIIENQNQIRIEADLEQKKIIENQNQIRIEAAQKKAVEKKAKSLEKFPGDLKYRIDNNEQFGKALVIDFSPRENKKQIVHDAISEELNDILPIGYNIDNSSVEIIISDKLKKYELAKINDLKQDLSDEKGLSKLLKKINKNYAKYKKDKFLGLDNTNINKPSITLSSLSLSEFDFDSDIIISSWLRNELYRGATSLYFPDKSFLFGGYLMPNKVAIFKDPKSVNTIIHLFFYEYPNLNFNENLFEYGYKSKQLESRSERYSGILLRGADFWNNDNKEIWRYYYTGAESNTIDPPEGVKMSLTSSDYSGFLSRRIQSNDLIKNSYSELFGISNPNSINVKAFIFGENGIQYLGIE